MPRDPDRAVLVRKALQERLLETLRYLAEEIELRRVGGLGEAQAAGYVAGRLQRAEQQAAVTSFSAGVGHTTACGLIVLMAALGTAAILILPREASYGATPWVAVALLAVCALLIWSEVEGPGWLGQMLGSRNSQSVVGVRAAVGSIPLAPVRVVLLAPLDRSPQLPPRLLLLLSFAALLLEAVLVVISDPVWSGVSLAAGGGAAALGGIAAAMLVRPWFPGPEPAILGAGELAALVAIAEELGELQQVELWTIALGAVSTGESGLQHLLQRYPFGADTCFINLHHMTGGQPVYVTREGLLRDHRSDRRLLALASAADAADVTINAEPRRIRRRTLVTRLLRDGFRAITITTYRDTAGVTGVDPRTLERAVKLVVGMIRELDQEEAKDNTQGRA